MNYTELFSGMYGKLGSGMCRLSINGDIAVKTSSGYKTYNIKTGRLVNQNNFVFNIGEEFFFVFPTNKVTKGDIILAGGLPKCVIETGKNKITVIDYECGEIKTIIPERHIFMGNTYFYGKIVSMFGNNVKGGSGKIFKYMAMMELFKGQNGASIQPQGGIQQMLPMMMMMGGGMNFDKMFEGAFDFDTENVEEDETEEDIDVDAEE